MFYLGTPPDAQHEVPPPSPATPGPSRPPGAHGVCPLPRGQRPPGRARRRRLRVPHPPRGRVADPRPRGLARPLGVRGPRREAARGGGRPGRLRFGRDRPDLPATAGSDRRGEAVRHGRPGLRHDRASCPGLLLETLRGEARGGLGDREPAGRRPDRRSRPPHARAEGLAGARGLAPPRGLRAAHGGRDALHDPRLARAHGLRLRGPGAGPVLADPAFRARAAPPVLRRAGPRPGDRLGLHPTAPCRLPPRPRDSRPRAGRRPGPAARGGGARVARALLPHLHDRRAAAALPVVADALPRRRSRGLSLGRQEGADLRALGGRARGREPLRPGPALPDLHLPFGGGPPGTPRTTVGWWTSWTTTSRPASTPSGSRCSRHTPCA